MGKLLWGCRENSTGPKISSVRKVGAYLNGSSVTSTLFHVKSYIHPTRGYPRKQNMGKIWSLGTELKEIWSENWRWPGWPTRARPSKPPWVRHWVPRSDPGRRQPMPYRCHGHWNNWPANARPFMSPFSFSFRDISDSTASQVIHTSNTGVSKKTEHGENLEFRNCTKGNLIGKLKMTWMAY